jgi:4-alpha-glucanotransferase
VNGESGDCGEDPVTETNGNDLLHTRGSGILLHPTSLPSPYGIGDLGPESRNWVDKLSRMRQRLWQILPLGPTGFADSPYQCLSAFANNPLLISPDDLVRDGLLEAQDALAMQSSVGPVDYGSVVPAKTAMLSRAWAHFQRGKAGPLRREFESYRRKEAAWLNDFSLYMTIKETQGLSSWQDWPVDLKFRDPKAIRRVVRTHPENILEQKFRQFLFFRQWSALREYALARRVRIIGDMPIFVSLDSADAWSRPEIFLLNKERQPIAVAGVPPDYFSATGQLWGNPHYRWGNLRKENYAWWVERFQACFRTVDVVRVDHFRGFEAAYHIPFGAPTAEHGKWVKSPGMNLFNSLRAQLGEIPVIAEDLGVITPAVEKMRNRFNFPGMRILQFAFDDPTPENPYLPENYEPNTVAYTGTHDNDTVLGWYATLAPEKREIMKQYAGSDEEPVGWQLIRLAWKSAANLAIVPLQDILGLGTEARMNTPGITDGNWRWRFHSDQLTDSLVDRLTELTILSRRGASSGE